MWSSRSLVLATLLSGILSPGHSHTWLTHLQSPLTESMTRKSINVPDFLSVIISTGLDMLACLSDPQSSWSSTNNWHLIRVVLCVVDKLLILKLECHLQSPVHPCVSVYLCVFRADINHYCACLCCMTVQDWELGHAHHPHTAGTAVG